MSATTGNGTGARPLTSMCLTVIKRHINNVTNLGTIGIGEQTPKMALRILDLVQRPKQLKEIEKNSPHLTAHTGPLYFRFITKEVVGWRDMLLHKSKQDGHIYTEEEAKQKATYNVYLKCLGKAEEANRKAIKRLQQKNEALKQASLKKETRIINAIPVIKQRARPAPQSELRFSHGSKTKNVLTKIRRETADARLKQPGSRLGTPTHLLNRQPMRAPGQRSNISQKSAPYHAPIPGSSPRPLSTPAKSITNH